MTSQFLNRVVLAIASDIHYPYPPHGSIDDIIRLFQKLSRIKPKALILAGDFLGSPTSQVIKSFARFLKRFCNCPVHVVLGNHEHYLSRSKSMKGWNSLDLRKWLINELKKYEIGVLDSNGPLRIEDVWITGVAGWYDYSFAPRGFSEEDFNRCNPYGIPVSRLEYCERKNQWGTILCPIGVRLDCVYIKIPRGHKWYARENVKTLIRQFKSSKTPRIVITHHVPWKELLRYTGNPLEDFYKAYDGSGILGEFLQENLDIISIILYGHVHRNSVSKIAYREGVPVVNSYPWYTETPCITLVTLHGKKIEVELECI